MDQHLLYPPAVAGTCERGPHALDPQKHRHRQFHRLFSVKAGRRVVLCAGQLEADAIFACEGDPEVASLCEQALRVYGPIGTRPYLTLTLGLTYRSGDELFLDIHRDSELQLASDGRRLPEHWQRVEALCLQNGHRCEVLTDEDIERHRTRIANWRHLLPFVRQAYDLPNPEMIDDIVELLDVHGDLSLDELGRRVSPSEAEDVLPAVARLLHDGRCGAELDATPFIRGRPISLTRRA